MPILSLVALDDLIVDKAVRCYPIARSTGKMATDSPVVLVAQDLRWLRGHLHCVFLLLSNMRKRWITARESAVVPTRPSPLTHGDRRCSNDFVPRRGSTVSGRQT